MINKVILIGRVGKDPEVRHLDNNSSVARFTLATSESYKNKNGEKVTNTEWHNIVVWRALSGIVERYVKKGMMLYVEGKIRSRSWDDKDGIKRYTTEIEAENFQMLSKVEGGETGSYTPNPNTAATHTPQEYGSDADFAANNNPTDDLPF